MFTARNPHAYVGKTVGSGHCVPFCREATGAPQTAHWRRGASVRHGEVPPVGTLVATFDPNGRYGNHLDGRSHAAIFLARQAEGIRVLDQWIGRAVAERTIRYSGGQGLPCDDGNAYFIVEVGSDIA